MTETLKNLLNRVAGDIHAVTIGFAILQGYLEGSCAAQGGGNENGQSVLFIENTPNKEKIKRMLINLNLKGSVRRRADGLLELRVWLDGKRCSFYGRTEEELVSKFKSEYKKRRRAEKAQALKAPSATTTTPPKEAESVITFGDMAEEWFDYKKGKVHPHTWDGYRRIYDRDITAEVRGKDIKQIRTAELNALIRGMTRSQRIREEMRILFNSVFKYAQMNGIIIHNPVTLIPFERAERTPRRCLTPEEIKIFFATIKQPKFDNVRQAAYAIYFFGVRPCELDDEAHIEGDFLICRNRKRKKGRIEYKKIPVHPTARQFIDSTQPLKPRCCSQYCSKILAQVLPGELTAYSLRHTFATTCQKYVRPDIVDIWMGDSPERLVGRVYTHFDDEFMLSEMAKVDFTT